MKDQAAPKPGRQTAKGSDKDADTRALEADLSANLKMDVRIEHSAGGETGQLMISYKSLDDLDKLCQLLSGLPDDV